MASEPLTDESDLLRCTDCGRDTDVTAASLFETMGRTKKGTYRRGRKWLRTLQSVVAGWLCDDCLKKAEAEYE